MKIILQFSGFVREIPIAEEDEYRKLRDVIYIPIIEKLKFRDKFEVGELDMIKKLRFVYKKREDDKIYYELDKVE